MRTRNTKRCTEIAISQTEIRKELHILQCLSNLTKKYNDNVMIYVKVLHDSIQFLVEIVQTRKNEVAKM